MSEKKAMIKDGKNIDVEVAVVINKDVSLAKIEKDEAKEEAAETKVAETSEDKKEENVLENSASLPEINIPEVPIAQEIPVSPEIPVGVGMPTFDMNSQVNQVETPNYNETEVQNFEPQTENTFDFNNSSIKTKSVIGNRNDVNNLKVATKNAMSDLVDQAFKPVEDEMDLLIEAHEIISIVNSGKDRGGEFYFRVNRWLNDYKGVQEVEEPYTSEYDSYKNYGDDENSYTGYDKVA